MRRRAQGLRRKGKSKMGKKKKPEVSGLISEIRDKADGMLWSIQAHSNDMDTVQRVIDAEIARIREKYANELAEKTAKKVNAEKALKKFALKNRVDLFGLDGDKITLRHGILLYSKADKVTIPKDAIDRITALGWEEGIKKVPTIDRPVIEAWNDEKLAAIGATKKPKEEISWEIKKKAEAV